LSLFDPLSRLAGCCTKEATVVADLTSSSIRSRCVGTTAVIYASDYLNKLSGERIERECKRQLDSGCRALVIDFRDTELVNSIGISILLGVIDVAEKNDAQVIFSDVNNQTVQLFEMLGLTRHVALAKDEQAALSSVTEFTSIPQAAGH
jgi:anti-anti-sigma factor